MIIPAQLEKSFAEHCSKFPASTGRRTFAAAQLTIMALELARWAGVEADELVEDVAESLAYGLHRDNSNFQRGD